MTAGKVRGGLEGGGGRPLGWLRRLRCWWFGHDGSLWWVRGCSFCGHSLLRMHGSFRPIAKVVTVGSEDEREAFRENVLKPHAEFVGVDLASGPDMSVFCEFKPEDRQFLESRTENVRAVARAMRPQAPQMWRCPHCPKGAPGSTQVAPAMKHPWYCIECGAELVEASE